jgi:hypothetical protein
MMWPCCLCFSFGYLCALCTLGKYYLIPGLSFCFPYVCVSDAHSAMQRVLIEANRNFFNKNGYVIAYKSKCSTSWLEISENNSSESNLIIVNNQINN